MSPDEAYETAMGVVDELRDQGIRVSIKPSQSRNSKNAIKKYSGEDRVKPEKWNHVSFYPETDEHKEAIHLSAKKLGWLGIFFDTGGCAGQRDWELDWSFRVKQETDSDLENQRDELEDMITSMEQ